MKPPNPKWHTKLVIRSEKKENEERERERGRFVFKIKKRSPSVYFGGSVVLIRLAILAIEGPAWFLFVEKHWP